jgi:hypothetical protein
MICSCQITTPYVSDKIGSKSGCAYLGAAPWRTAMKRAGMPPLTGPGRKRLMSATTSCMCRGCRRPTRSC